MDGKQIVGGFILLIGAFLLINNAKNTNQVISALSGGLTNETLALQGRTPATSGVGLTGIPTLS